MLFAGRRTHLQTYKLTHKYLVNIQGSALIPLVATKQRELCYKNYNQNMTLPEWDIEQERYWQVATVNSVLEYIVYSCTLVEEKFQDILFWKSLSVFICEKNMIWCALQLKKYFKIFRFGKFCLFSFVRRVWFDALPVVDGLWGHKIWEHSWGSTK